MYDGFLTPELSEAIAALIGVLVAYIAYKTRQDSLFQRDWRAAEEMNNQPILLPIEGDEKTQEGLQSGSIALYENEYQSAEGLEKMLDSVPSGAKIIKVDEGIASNGSKYRIVYWRLKN